MQTIFRISKTLLGHWMAGKWRRNCEIKGEYLGGQHKFQCEVTNAMYERYP